MKKISMFLMLFLIVSVQAQNYKISFAGKGASSAVDSVKVENLTQCTSTSLIGSDTLNLTSTTGINTICNSTDNTLHIYPNPMTGYCLIDFEATAQGETNLELYDIAGKKITQVQELLMKGEHKYSLSGIAGGIYVLKVESNQYAYSAKIVSTNSTSGIAKIKLMETVPASGFQTPASNIKAMKSLKSNKLINMQYNTNDTLKLTGFSSIYSTVFMLVPAKNQTDTFNFIPCTDGDNNNYTVVKIGTQWWMAQNLNYGTYEDLPASGAQPSGYKYCQNLSGDNDPTCPMGGIYEWANMMNGSASCNGTGAGQPGCTTPVQGFCPIGWHVPSHYEWTLLETAVGSDPGAFPYDVSTTGWLGANEGNNLKETCTSDWKSGSTATNSSGFTGFPGGGSFSGAFYGVGQVGIWWSATEDDALKSDAWGIALGYLNPGVDQNHEIKTGGWSVRCVKD